MTSFQLACTSATFAYPDLARHAGDESRFQLVSAFDGFELGAYHAQPADARHGGLVLIQEIFGVTDHIRELADGFADDRHWRSGTAAALLRRAPLPRPPDAAGDDQQRQNRCEKKERWRLMIGRLPSPALIAAMVR